MSCSCLFPASVSRARLRVPHACARANKPVGGSVTRISPPPKAVCSLAHTACQRAASVAVAHRSPAHCANFLERLHRDQTSYTTSVFVCFRHSLLWSNIPAQCPKLPIKVSSFQEQDKAMIYLMRGVVGISLFLFPGSNGCANGRETKLNGRRAGSGGRLHHSFGANEGMRTGRHYYRATAD
jgi:hypothetical protein